MVELCIAAKEYGNIRVTLRTTKMITCTNIGIELYQFPMHKVSALTWKHVTFCVKNFLSKTVIEHLFLKVVFLDVRRQNLNTNV